MDNLSTSIIVDSSTLSKLPAEAQAKLRSNIRVFGFDNQTLWKFNSLQDLYESCVYIRTIIDTIADCVRNVNVRLYKTSKTGEDVEIFDHPVLSLLNNPNPLQTVGDWMAQRLIFQKLYGQSFIRGVRGRTNRFIDSKALWNLLPSSVRIVEHNEGVNDITSRFTLDEIVNRFEYTSREGMTILQPSEVLMWVDYRFGFSGKSEVQTLMDSASNLMAIQESRGQIIKHRGMTGFISPEPGNDITGAQLTLKDEKTKNGILSGIKKLYGTLRGQSQIALLEAPVKWTPVTVDIQKLRLTENEKAEFDKCCDLLGVPREIFDGKSTFDNQAEAKKKLYTDRVIPWVKGEFDQIAYKMELQREGLRLEGDFSHLEVLQDDMKVREEVEMMKTERLLKLKDAKQIEAITVNKELGYDIKEVSDGKE
jgi:HK97 family phage portal protein